MDVERIPEPLKTINALTMSAATILSEALLIARTTGEHENVLGWLNFARAACGETRTAILATIEPRGGRQPTRTRAAAPEPTGDA